MMKPEKIIRMKLLTMNVNNNKPMKFQVVVILLAFLNTACLQEKVCIEGRWKEVKAESVFPEAEQVIVKKYKPIIDYEFNAESKCKDYTFDPYISEVEYTIKEDILTVGKIEFVIEKCNGDELVLRDFNSRNPTNKLIRRHFFKKMKS
jgi:hypothetical protein